MSNEQLSAKLLEQAVTIKYIMESFKQSQQENKEQHSAIMQSQVDFHIEMKQTLKEMGEKLDAALDKKANKWVEDGFKYVIYAVCGAVLTGLLYLVIK